MAAVGNDEKGVSNYYIIVGKNGVKIDNAQLQDYVADPVELAADAKQVDDWIVLYVKSKPDIKRIAELSWAKIVMYYR